jgi:predicted PilT family ATPase
MLSLFLASRPLAARSMMVARSSTVMATSPISWFSTAPEGASPAEGGEGNTSEETITVPKAMVRFLIGVKGRNLASLAERSGGAKILFTKEENAQGEEVAKIMGDPTQIAQMRQLIKDDLEKLKNDPMVNQSRPERSEGGKGGNYMEEVIIESQYVGFLIGKQGLVLKEMENVTGARIQYSTRDDTSQERTARILGSPAQVASAKKLITEKIYAMAADIRTRKPYEGGGDRRFGGDRGGFRGQERGPPRSRQGSPGDVKQVVEVPSECVGPLIGKGGKSLFHMQDSTGAKFEFAKEDHRDGAREVTIFGSEDQIKQACDLIQQRVQEVLERNESGH